MSVDTLWYRSAADLASALGRKELSPVEVMKAIGERIEAVNPALNAFWTPTLEQAMVDAQAAEQRRMRDEARGPLDGVPFSVKDTIWTAGVRTTMGSAIFADFVPPRDAIVVERLKAAGAICLGKVATPEYASKGATDSLLFGVTRNPYSLAHTCGGSSGGSAAAVAAGMGRLSVGTDEGGSIRIPASFCGVVGLKPTYGLIPRFPIGRSELTSHLGPLVRTVADAALFLQVVAGRDDRDAASLPGSGSDGLTDLGSAPALRVAWSPTLGYATVHPVVQGLTASVPGDLAELGWEVDCADPAFDDPAPILDVIDPPTLAAVLGEYLPVWRDRMDPHLVNLVEKGQRVSGVDFARGLLQRQRLWEQVHEFFQVYDLLVTPTVAVPPWLAGWPQPEEIAGQPLTSSHGWSPFTYPFNLTGQPAISLPYAWTENGLPVGIQFIGRRLEDNLVLRAAAAFEAAKPWIHRRPQLT